MALKLGSWVRLLIDLAVIVPASVIAPRSLAMRLANLVAEFDARYTRQGRDQSARLAAAHGGSDAVPQRAWAGQGSYWRELVDLTRLAVGRDPVPRPLDVDLLPVSVRQVIASKRSFILAYAHFNRAGTCRMLAALRSVPTRLPAPFVVPELETITRPPDPNLLREWLRQVLMHRFSRRIPGGSGVTFPVVAGAGRPNAARAMSRALRHEGGVVAVAVDRPWNQPGSFERPFAGTHRRRFSAGAFRLAASARVPIVAVITQPDGSLEWPRVFEVVSKATVAQVADETLDLIERYVGSRRDEYIISAGEERVWNSARAIWEDRRSITLPSES